MQAPRRGQLIDTNSVSGEVSGSGREGELIMCPLLKRVLGKSTKCVCGWEREKGKGKKKNPAVEEFMVQL